MPTLDVDERRPPSRSCSAHAHGTAGTEQVAMIRSNGACSGSPSRRHRGRASARTRCGEPLPGGLDEAGVDVDGEHLRSRRGGEHSSAAL